jgi:hypothetical protein
MRSYAERLLRALLTRLDLFDLTPKFFERSDQTDLHLLQLLLVFVERTDCTLFGLGVAGVGEFDNCVIGGFVSLH